MESAPKGGMNSKTDGHTREKGQTVDQQIPKHKHMLSKTKVENIGRDDGECEQLDDSGSEGDPTCEDNHVRNDHDALCHEIGIHEVRQYHRGETEQAEV